MEVYHVVHLPNGVRHLRIEARLKHNNNDIALREKTSTTLGKKEKLGDLQN